MKAKKIYMQPTIDVALIESQIIATSNDPKNISLPVDTDDIENEGYAD